MGFKSTIFQLTDIFNNYHAKEMLEKLKSMLINRNMHKLNMWSHVLQRFSEWSWAKNAYFITKHVEEHKMKRNEKIHFISMKNRSKDREE